MKAVRLTALLISVGGLLVASCEQEIVVVDHGGGGEAASTSGIGGSTGYVATSDAVSTVTGFGGGCPGAPAPVQPFTTCESITGTGATGGPTLCSKCVSDGAGTQYLTQCSDNHCNCYIGDDWCFPCEGDPEDLCGVSCCLYPWNALDSG